MIHELKTWPQYFCRVADGSKTFEVRKNDRGFQQGDEVLLREWNPKTELTDAYTGWSEDVIGYTDAKPLRFKIGYVFPIDAERVVFSLLPNNTTDTLSGPLLKACEALDMLTKVGPPSQPCVGKDWAYVCLVDNCNLATKALAEINRELGIE